MLTARIASCVLLPIISDADAVEDLTQVHGVSPSRVGCDGEGERSVLARGLGKQAKRRSRWLRRFRRSRHQKPDDGDGHSGCREYCSDDPPEKASFEVGDCSVNLGNVNFGRKAGEVGPSAFAHRLYNGFGLWPFEASGFQVAGCGERVKRDVHDVIILQFVSRVKVE